MKGIFLSIVVVIVAWIFYSAKFRAKAKSPVIELATGGKIQGVIEKSRDGREFYSYKGIPYAKAERFQPPRDPDKWDGIKSTAEYGSMCVQVDNLSWRVAGSEDCLFINVFKPKDAPKGAKILAFIHGGYFMTGSSQMNNPHYFMDEEIILVTFHYRVGSLGFLSTSDGVIAGNFGLQDQQFALKWIQKNIAAFGGDPNEVTLFGESAGASSVHLHVLSPSSKGLFKKAGSSSGTAIKIWSLSIKPKEQALRLGKRLNCPVESSELLKKCLLNLKAEDIIATQIETITPLINPLIMYGPTVEKRPGDVFLPDHPYTLMTLGKYNKVPYLLGMNADEGLLITGRIAKDETLKTDLEENYESVLPQYLFYPPEKRKVTQKITQFYLQTPPEEDNGKLDFNANFRNLTNMMTDRLYLVATREAALYHATQNKVFLYYNKYQGEFSFTTFFGFTPRIHWTLQLAWKLISMDISKKLGLYNYHEWGVSHGDDLFLLFSVPYMEITPGSRDYEFSKTLVNLWVQFAHDENNMSCNGASWTPVSPNALTSTRKIQYLTFETTGNHGMKDEEFTERVEFYKTLNLPWIL